jgi:uncharacterized protein
MISSTVKRSPLIFFLLVYILTIPLWVIETIVEVKGLPLDIPVTDLVAAFTPLIAALILIYKEQGQRGVKNLLRRVFDFSRISQKTWYAPVILLPPLIFLLIFGLMQLMALPLPIELHIPIVNFPFLFVFFFFGAAGEEVGYTGYAADPLQQRWGALSTGVIIGLPWAIWHYPSIIEQGHDAIWIAWGTLGTVGMRILIIWLYNNTGRSLFACILFHTLYNVGRPLFPKDATHNPLVDYPYAHYSVIAAVSVIVILLWDSKTLSRLRTL